MQEFKNERINGFASHEAAKCMEQQQWTKYGSNGGTGFAAEDANALNDLMHGKVVDKTGLNNALNGADRIVNGVEIQTKYFDTAWKSVDAAFNNGTYRYSGMRLEVPADQYDRALELFAERIRRGEVPGVTNPADASKIVMRGNVSYQQARNIARAGNIDSIKFDMQTQAVTCGLTAGLSFGITYAVAIANGKSHGEALTSACKQSAKSGLTAMGVGVATQQMMRTQVGRNVAAAVTQSSRHVVNAACKTEVGKQVVQRTASAIAGKQVFGAAAKNVVTKAARSNAIVGGVMLAAQTIPDVIDCCNGKKSVGEVAENAVCNASGIVGGSGGAWAGAAVGTAICPVVGTVIGSIVGGIAGGIGASEGVRSVIDWFS